eukprot:6491699-Amphidinium_carterae.1
MSEVRQFRAEEEHCRLHEQLFEHQGRLQEQMIASVQHQANHHTARVQEEARGFQRAVQDNAEAVIAQRVSHEAAVYQNILNGNIHQRDEEYMHLIRSRDEEYVSSMATVTSQRDVDLLNLSHVRTMLEESQTLFEVKWQVQEAQTYRQEITTYMAEAAQLNQSLQHVTQVNEHSGQAQATSDWNLRTELQAANRELSLSENREITNLNNLARVQADLDTLRMRVATEEQPSLELTAPRPIATQLWPSPTAVALPPLLSVPASPAVPYGGSWGSVPAVPEASAMLVASPTVPPPPPPPPPSGNITPGR